jgi:hypothetical protein
MSHLQVVLPADPDRISDISLICDNKTVSQLKMCDFLGETFKGFEVL